MDLLRRISRDTADDCDLSGVVLDDYSIVREVGRGGMGIVFEAIQNSLNRHVALKILPLTSAMNARALSRFEREAEAAASLEHPNIVRAYARGEDDGIFFLSMQFIDGLDLAEFIDLQCLRSGVPFCHPEQYSTVCREDPKLVETGDVNPGEPGVSENEGPDNEADRQRRVSSLDADYFRQIARIGQQAADALHYAHNKGVVHRDIKPSNLLLDKQQDVWVADFGLALLERAQNHTATGRVLGTLRYSSPEQLRGDRDLDGRTDVYSLGATLFELATLRPAFPDSNAGRLVSAITENPPPRPSKLSPHIPRDLESVIMKAMSKDPGDRYETAQEFSLDLRRFLLGEPVRAKRGTMLAYGLRWLRRNPLVSLLALAVLVLVSMLSVSTAFFVRRQNEFIDRIESSDLRFDQTLAEFGEAIQEQRRLQASLEMEEEMAKDRRYAADLASIALLVQSGDHENGNRRLQRHIPEPGQPDRRGFVWRYLWAICGHTDATLRKHEHEVLTANLSEPLGVLVSGDKDGTVWVWNLNTKETVVSLSFDGEVQDLEFTPNQERLVVAGTGGIIQLYNTKTWELEHSFRGHRKNVKGVEFTSDGKTMVSCSRDNDIAWWNTADWRRLRRIEDAHDTVQDIAMSADSQWLVSGGSDGLTKVWNVSSGELEAEFKDHNLAVLTTAISSDGGLVAAGGYEQKVALFDRISGKRVARIPLSEQAWSLAFFEDDKKLILGTNFGDIRVYDITDPAQPRLTSVRSVQEAIIRSLRLASGESILLTSSDDTTLRLSTMPGTKLHEYRQLENAYAREATFSPDGDRVAMSFLSHKIVVFDRALKERATYPSPGSEESELASRHPRIAFDQDATLWAAAAAGRRAYFRSVSRTSQTAEYSVLHKYPLKDVWLSDNGSLAIALDTENRGVLWQLSPLKLLGNFDLPSNSNDIAFSGDGQEFCVATDSGEVILYDRSGGERILKTTSQRNVGLYSVAFSPTGPYLAAAGFEGAVNIWDTQTGELLREFRQQNEIVMLRFSRDGRYLVTGSDQLNVWHVSSGQHMMRLGRTLYRKRYETAAFSPRDDALTATGDQADSAIDFHLWDTRQQ